MTDPDQPAVVTVALNEIEATLIIAKLDANDIEAHAEGALTSGFRAEVPGGVRVMVRQSDVERAKQILNTPNSS